MKKRLLVVLGMHRSGTSVVTRALPVMDVALGNDLLPPMEMVNEKGFWEDQGIVLLNEEILASLSSAWYHLLPVTPGEVEQLKQQGFLARAEKLLAEKMRDYDIFGAKDPRFVKLLPFWKDVFANLNLDVSYIIVLRHPLSVSQSLIRRDGFPVEKVHLMWLDHMVNILDMTTGHNRTLIDYDFLMEHPEQAILQLAHSLQLPVDPVRLQEFINRFLDSGLRHTIFTYTDLLDKPAVPSLMLEIYSELLNLSSGKLESLAFTEKVSGWKKSLSEQKLSWVLTNELTAKNVQANLLFSQQSARLAERDAQLVERDARLAERDAQLAERDAQLAERDARLAERDARLTEMDAQLNERDAQLNEIQASKAWRTALLLRKIRVWLAPPGSLRARWGRKLLPLFFLPLFLYRNYRTMRDLQLIRGSNYFYAEWYLAQNPDVAFAGSDPARHYLLFGGFEGRDPSPHFLSKQYLLMYPDVLAAKMNPLVHYLRFGQKEGRHSFARKKIDVNAIHQSNTTFSLLGRLKVNINFVISLLTPPRIKTMLILLGRGGFKEIVQRVRTIRSLYFPEKIFDDPENFASLDAALNLWVDRPSDEKQKKISSEVDIIVPVFNGMHLLERLFESIFQNTWPPFNLIVINDCSSDPSVGPFLEKLAAEHPNVKLIKNEHNKGFVKSVNIAASQAQNHFVILNTDVEVPAGWLERLMLPIVYDNRIASTTPFTNSGSICSFPEPNVDNELAYGLDLKTIDLAFQRIDPSRAVTDLPTGVGFCMGMNINVWQEIGGFDDVLFGRGYGEENDWCMRASMRGYRNVIVPNLFVYHKHGGSFSSKEKQDLMARNYVRLVESHPEYPYLVQQFIAEDPLSPIRILAKLLLATDVATQTCLIFDHALGGGTTSYREKLVKEHISDGQTILLVTNRSFKKTYRLEVICRHEHLVFELNNLEILYALSEHIPIKEIICNSLVSYENVPETLDVILNLKEKNDAFLSVRLHDFFPLCPSYNLLNNKGNYCDLPVIDICKHCLPENPHKFLKADTNIILWRREWSMLLGLTDSIVCFSKSSADILQRVYQVKSEQIIVQPHGLPNTLRKVKTVSSPLCIGVVGGINHQKGYQIILDMAEILEKNAPDVKIIIVGDMVSIPTNRNIVVLGRYEPNDLPDIIEKNRINLAFFSSISPETFSYVISELMQMGLPICAFDLGAPAERLRDYPLGHLISKISPDVAVKEILEFHEQLISREKKN